MQENLFKLKLDSFKLDSFKLDSFKNCTEKQAQHAHEILTSLKGKGFTYIEAEEILILAISELQEGLKKSTL